MKFRFILAIVIVLACGLMTWAYSPAAVQAYIAQYKNIALNNEKQFGIPAPIILAQGILESGAGESSLTRSSNNHFGIKSGNSWKGRIHRAWDDEKEKSKFRCYNSAAESYADHARVLTSGSRYRNLFNLSIYDYRGWAYGLKAAGYASAPHYAQALIGIIEQYRLYEINNGVKLKPGKTVTITRYIEIEKPVFEENITEEEDESEEQAMIAEADRHYVVEINNIHCTIVQPGETLANVARRYDISPVELIRYNELVSENQVKEGDIIFLDKKKKRYEGSQDSYLAKDGETLHDVSQKFGIQLRQLAKMNNLSEYALLQNGNQINLK